MKEQLYAVLNTLQSWQDELAELVETLNEPVELYLDSHFTCVEVARLLAPRGIVDLLDCVKASLQAEPSELSPEQVAWDTLTRLVDSVGALERKKRAKELACLFHVRSVTLFNEYERARESILLGLYDRISNRFKDLYRILHEDEKDFAAHLHPSGPSLDFKVDFFGRGAHPPHALHSEGHQDSMGLCLFFALNEEITESKSNLIILDDVVMSIDSGHRKAVCRLLKEEFPDHQFIITTHDRTWSKQLKQEQVVESNRVKDLLDWSVETGPLINQKLDMWEEIEDALSQEKVDKVAFNLRKGSEEFFEAVCDALAAPVTYNSNGQWQLDDWLPAATKQYTTLIQRAHKDANKHKNQALVDTLTNLESKRKQIYGRIHIEQWSINAAVHYNNWENLSKQDFVDVVDAFRDLHGLFLCSYCGRFLQLLPRKGKNQVFMCRCGKVNWNLATKQ